MTSIIYITKYILVCWIIKTDWAESFNTFNYYINVTFFPWLEVGYTCNLFTAKSLGLDKYGYSGYTNQDRSFHGRLRVWKEGWWKEWTPQVVVGVNDFTTGSGGDNLMGNLGDTLTGQ